MVDVNPIPGVHPECVSSDATCNRRHLDSWTWSSRSSQFDNSIATINPKSDITQNRLKSNQIVPEYKVIGAVTKVCQLNIEGISKDKCDYLSKICLDNHIDIIVLQETHVETEEKMFARGNVRGYILVDFIPSKVHGIATYVRENIDSYEMVLKHVFSGIFVLAIKVADLHIVNVYKPPNVAWPIGMDILYPHPVVYVGDFNCHHTLWGYEQNDENGVALYSWMDTNNLHVVFDAKDRKTFHSARWRKDYNPDLCIVSCNSNYKPLECSRKVMQDFPHSQHRPTVISIGLQIPIVESVQKPRWNFVKADWNSFKKQVDANIRWVSAVPSNYEKFIKIVKAAAKRTVPRGYRKEYIPGWSKEIQDKYKKYTQEPSQENADAILSSLNQNRKRKWDNLMQSMDFTHSSRSSWGLLKKLGAATQTAKKSYKISPNAIAARLVQVSNLVDVNKTEKNRISRKLRRLKKVTSASDEIGAPFTIEELQIAIKHTKTSKAAGFDGIYPEFFKHFGDHTLKWLVTFYNHILSTGRMPTEFKQSKVIAILKPGRDQDDPKNYRPISLLSVAYKVLERMLFQRISPLIEEVLPPEQAGFRSCRNCCDQVLTLTNYIETGFQKKLKTGVAFVDLTAAYDTVWKDGLLYKLYNAVPCGKVVNLIDSMLSNRKFRVFVGENSSSFKYLNNGLPQGSVLAPLLFNLYVSDLPITKCRKFIYADDLALAVQHSEFVDLEMDLKDDVQVMVDYFTKWRLCPNPQKTEVSCFHLNNQKKKQELHVEMNGLQLKHNFNPVYLGVTLDTSLTYNLHADKVKQKLKTRNNIIHKLAGSNWGVNPETLRTATVSLVFSVSEYCCPVWLNSAHVPGIDAELNSSMRLISGTIKSTPTSWLPVLCNIVPPNIRRWSAANREWRKINSLQDKIPIFQDLQNPPPLRLKSRSPFWSNPCLRDNYSEEDTWKSEWAVAEVFNHHLIEDPTVKVPGFDLSRQLWCKLNRIRTGHGRCNSMLSKWNVVPSPYCSNCNNVEETISHIVQECPLTKFNDGFDGLHEVTPDALDWLQNLKSI